MACKTLCEACKPGDLPILFTRYAACFSADQTRRDALSKLKPDGQFKPPKVALHTSGYSVRMLRQGVLYVLTERAGHARWTGYMVHSSGCLSEFNPELTPVPDEPASPACEMAFRGSNKSLVWVADPKAVSNLWYFFSPDPVLPDILKSLKANTSKLHHIPVAAWVDSCPATPHTCTSAELSTQVGEWAALTDAALLDGLNEQIYGVMGITTSERGYGKGQVPVYMNASGKTTTSPPVSDIFSADNPQGQWRRTERLAPGELPTYEKVHAPRLKNIAKALAGDPANRRLAGIVAACNDAIGIAQELNHWRNKAYRELIQWGDVVEPGDNGNTQSRKTRFEVAHGWNELAGQFKKKRIALMLKNVALGQGVSDRPQILEEMTEAQRRAPMQGRVFQTRAEYNAFVQRLQTQTEAATGPVAERRWQDYARALDEEAMAKWRAKYTEQAKEFEAKADNRAPDHLRWARSEELQAALAFYDGDGKKNIAQGAKCAAQINGILEGFNGGGQGCEDQLMAWAKDFTNNPKNLLWRGYLLNQQDAQQSLDSALQGATPPGVSGAAIAAQLKNVIDNFGKLNDLMDSAAATQLANAASNGGVAAVANGQYLVSIKVAQAIPLFGVDKIGNLVTHVLLKVGAGKVGLENALIRKLVALSACGAGKTSAVGMFMDIMKKHVFNEEYLNKIEQDAKRFFAKNPGGAGVAKEAAIIAKDVVYGELDNFKQDKQRVLDSVVADGKAGEFFKMRATGALTMLEGFAFFVKAKELQENQNKDASLRLAAELGAAGLTLTAAALEVGAITQEWQIAKSSAMFAREIAALRHGGFKLAGSALAGIAGLVGVCLDISDAGKAGMEKRFALQAALFTRGGVNGLAFASGIALGLSYAGPLLEHLASTTGMRIFGVLGDAAALAVRYRAWLFAAAWWLTVANIVATFALAFLVDDEMEKWVKRSSFRKPPQPGSDGKTGKSEPLFEAPGAEIMALASAFKAI